MTVIDQEYLTGSNGSDKPKGDTCAVSKNSSPTQKSHSHDTNDEFPENERQCHENIDDNDAVDTVPDQFSTNNETSVVEKSSIVNSSAVKIVDEGNKNGASGKDVGGDYSLLESDVTTKTPSRAGSWIKPELEKAVV